MTDYKTLFAEFRNDTGVKAELHTALDAKIKREGERLQKAADALNEGQYEAVIEHLDGAAPQGVKIRLNDYVLPLPRDFGEVFGFLTAYNAETGQELWHWEPADGRCEIKQVRHDAARLYLNVEGSVEVLDIQTGDGCWSENVVRMMNLYGGVRTIAMAEDHLVVLREKSIYARDYVSGAIRWQRIFENREIEVGCGTPGVIYGVGQGHLYAMSTSCGKDLWQWTVPEIRVPEKPVITVTIKDETVIVTESLAGPLSEQRFTLDGEQISYKKFARPAVEYGDITMTGKRLEEERKLQEAELEALLK